MDQMISYYVKDREDYKAIAAKLDSAGVRFIDSDLPSTPRYDESRAIGIVIHKDEHTENVPVLFFSISKKEMDTNPVQSHDEFVRTAQEWMDSIDATKYGETLEKLRNKARRSIPFMDLLSMMCRSDSSDPWIKEIYLDAHAGADTIHEVLQRLEAETDAEWNAGQTPTGYTPKMEGMETLVVHFHKSGKKTIGRGLDPIVLLKELDDGIDREFFTNAEEFIVAAKQ